MNRVSVQAFAKINLSLNITGTKGSLHTLDMVLASVDLADVISIWARDDNQVVVRYENLDIKIGVDSVSRAVTALKKLSGQDFGADIVVKKQIPVAAGLGGSGVDAAGTIVGLKALFGLDELHCRAAAVACGSDVLYQLTGGFARVGDEGQTVAPLHAPLVLYAVLCKGEGGGVLSRDAYQAFDSLYPTKRFCPTDTEALVAALQNGNAHAAYPHMKSALYRAACKLCPSVSQAHTALEDAGAAATLMTGSGSACVGFFESPDRAVQAATQLCNDGLWARAVKTLPRGIELVFP